MNLTLPLLIYRHWAQRASICSRRFANSTPNCEAAMNRHARPWYTTRYPLRAQFSISKIINSIMDSSVGRGEREREETDHRSSFTERNRMIRHFIPITFLQRDVTSNERIFFPVKDLEPCPLSRRASNRARQGGNELEGDNFCLALFSFGRKSMVGPPIFVRYTVEIFSLDSSWKARVNEFGKGLVNIRWLLNLCTRVNKYCACGTQEIREPEIVPSYLYICIYFWSYLFFHFSKLSFFFCWYLSSPTRKWFKLLNQRFVQVYCSWFYSVLL